MIAQEKQGGQKRKATISFEFEDEEGLEAIIEDILDSNTVGQRSNDNVTDQASTHSPEPCLCFFLSSIHVSINIRLSFNA